MTTTSPVQTVPIATRIEQYIKLRDLIKKEDDDHKQKMAPYRETLEKLNGVMLSHLDQLGADSVKGEAGTVYRTTKRSASLEDPAEFMRHVIGSEAWDLLDKKANLSAVEDFVKENGVLPPGVKLTSAVVVGVRRS